MCTLLAKIQIHPGKEALFEQVMAKMYEQTHATESEVLRYEYWRGREPSFYYCLLSFTSNQAFWEHQASDHHSGEMENFTACIADLDLEVVDPVQGSSPLPASNDDGPAANAAPSVVEEAGNFPIAVSEWWQALKAAS